MGFESPKEQPNTSLEIFSQLEKDTDPVKRSLFQETCLQVLKESDSNWFYENYTGEVDERGYLITKEKSTAASVLPSMSIGDGFMAEVVEKMKTP
jgi:hypothetical protein